MTSVPDDLRSRGNREVVAKQLLMNLSDKTKVALILTEFELELVILAIRNSPIWMDQSGKSMLVDLLQLRKEAFGKKGPITNHG